MLMLLPKSAGEGAIACLTLGCLLLGVIIIIGPGQVLSVVPASVHAVQRTLDLLPVRYL